MKYLFSTWSKPKLLSNSKAQVGKGSNRPEISIRYEEWICWSNILQLYRNIMKVVQSLSATSKTEKVFHLVCRARMMLLQCGCGSVDRRISPYLLGCIEIRRSKNDQLRFPALTFQVWFFYKIVNYFNPINVIKWWIILHSLKFIMFQLLSC